MTNVFLQRFSDLADKIQSGIPSADLFREVFSLIIESRVPWMPDTDEELAAMLEKSLEESDKGVFYTTEEVTDHLEKHAIFFEQMKAQFDAFLVAHAWDSAAKLIFDDMVFERGPYWFTYRNLNSHEVILHSHLSSGGGPRVDFTSNYSSLALLGAICEAFSAWEELWKR